MNYINRPGIELIQICGVMMLVPTRAASEYCPHIQRMPLLGSLVWVSLKNGKTLDEIYGMCGVLIKGSEEKVRETVDKILLKLCEGGYLIKEDAS